MREIEFDFIYSDGKGLFAHTTATLENLIFDGLNEDELYEQAMDSFHEDMDVSDFSLIAKRQYTGLKDKNGVEIYESDVVKCVDGHIGAIEWEENDCCFNVSDYYNSSNDYPTMAFMEGQPFEVIGNIYENKELLNT